MEVKKRGYIVALAILMMVLSLSSSGMAATANNEIRVYVNGEKVYFSDSQPFIQNDRTYVPFRAPTEALGATVDWYEKEQKVEAFHKGTNRKVELWIGNYGYAVNEKYAKMDVKPFVKNNRTYVPYRFIAEGLGADVDWRMMNKNGVDSLVFAFNLGQTEEEKQDIIDGIVKEVESTMIFNGYTIPLNKVHMEDGKPAGKEVEVADSKEADIYLGFLGLYADTTVTENYEIIKEILASKWGKDFANKIVDYAKQYDIMNRSVKIPYKVFYTSSGRLADVLGGDGYVSFVVYKEGIK